MEVTITQFRKDLFSLVQEATQGKEVWVKHKGGRFRIAPEKKPAGKLSRLTTMEIVNHDIPAAQLLSEMTQAWQKDWDDQL